jgi:hypothetical protein
MVRTRVKNIEWRESPNLASGAFASRDALRPREPCLVPLYDIA